MKIHRLHALFLLAYLLPGPARSQEDSARAAVIPDRYALKVVLDADHHVLQGEAQIRFRVLRDSVAQIHLLLGPHSTLTSVRDSLDRRIEHTEQMTLGEADRKEILIPVSDTVKRGDSLSYRIFFETAYDTTSTLPSFIGGKEILLTSCGQLPWWPVPSAATNPVVGQYLPVSLEVTLQASFLLLSNGLTDSLRSDGTHTTWKVTYAQPMPSPSCVLLLASSTLVKRTIPGKDSTGEFSLYYSPGRFHGELAKAALSQIRDAYAFFAALTGAGQRHPDVRIALIGTDDGRLVWSVSDAIILGRNSYAYVLFDSTLLSSPNKNPWVRPIAHLFDIVSADSTLWFSDGLANYLAVKYFLSKAGNDAESQQRVRLDLLSSTLDFYSSRPLSQGTSSTKNGEDVASSKGAYVFLMLEYLMGSEIFEGVLKTIYGKFTEGITIPEFQRLCEEEYGSRLDWFFKEWVYGTGFPEILLSTDVKLTMRGNYSVKARIIQRGDLFTTPVDLVFSSKTRSMTKRVFVDSQEQAFEFVLPFEPSKSELDPGYLLLRWVPRLRLLAHSRTAVSLRVLDRNLDESEREAALTIQLDPNNLTGWTNLALFSLGKAAVIRGNLTKAEEYFRRAWALETSEPTQLFSVLSLVRLGNVLEMEGRRGEAVELYKLSITLGERNPASFAPALIEAQKYLREKFVSSEDLWYAEY